MGETPKKGMWEKPKSGIFKTGRGSEIEEGCDFELLEQSPSWACGKTKKIKELKMREFKVGDKVRIKLSRKDTPDELMKFVESNNNVHVITEIENSGFENIILDDSDTWGFDDSDLEIIEDGLIKSTDELKLIKGKIEVGNYARLRVCDDYLSNFPDILSDKKPRKIISVGDMTCNGIFLELEDVGRQWHFKLSDLEIVEKLNLVRGKRYEVSNNEDFSNSRERIFDNYDEGFQEPYRCIDCMFEDEYENKFCIETDSWKYLREIQPKYKPYTEPKLEWLEDGKQIVFKATEMVTHICGIRVSGAKYVLQFGGIPDLPLEECYEKIEWLDGTPFGELINEN